VDGFCDEFKTTPKTLRALDSRPAYNYLFDAVRHSRGRGLAGSTIKGYLKPVIIWLRENDIEFTRSINIWGTSQTPALDAEKTPDLS
jgi:hypothetical protein